MDGKKLLKSIIGKSILMGGCFWTSILWAESGDETETQSDLVQIDPELEGTFYGALLKVDEKSALEFAHKGSDVDIRNSAGQTYLHLFIAELHSKNKTKIVQLLIECGADVNAKDNAGMTALLLAIAFHRFDVVRILLDNGADPHDFRLFVVIANDRLMRGRGLEAVREELDLLLAGGADIDERDPDGNTPLHNAIRNLLPDIPQLFLDRGAAINATNHKGQTPLDIALEQRAQVPDDGPERRDELDRIIALLREHGAVEGQPEDEVVAE